MSRGTTDRLKSGVKRVSSRLATALMRYGPGQRAVNVLSERGGLRVQPLVRHASITTDFTWRCDFAPGSFRIPVGADLERSWSDALTWRDRKYAPFRRFFLLMLDVLPPGVLIDIGANDGLYTSPFACNNYACHCIEPQTTCVEFIGRVCAVNGFSNVQIVQALVGAKEGEKLELYVADPDRRTAAGPQDAGGGGAAMLSVPVEQISSLVLENVERFHEAKAITMESITLDGYCQRHDIAPTLLKIDVEGWEWPVLQGARETLARHRPTIVIELFRDEQQLGAERAPQADRRPSIWQLVREMGYRAYAFREGPTEPLQRLESAGALAEWPGANFVFVQNARLHEAILRESERGA